MAHFEDKAQARLKVRLPRHGEVNASRYLVPEHWAEEKDVDTIVNGSRWSRTISSLAVSAYELYAETKKVKNADTKVMCQHFKDTFSERGVEVFFVGEWYEGDVDSWIII